MKNTKDECYVPITKVTVFYQEEIEEITLGKAVRAKISYFTLNLIYKKKHEKDGQIWHEYSISNDQWSEFAPNGLMSYRTIGFGARRHDIGPPAWTFFMKDDEYVYHPNKSDSFAAGHSVSEGSPFFINFLCEK